MSLRTVDRTPQIILDGDPDEAWEYDEWELPCCSFCLPCDGYMHSEEGVRVRATDVDSYAAALAGIVQAAVAD